MPATLATINTTATDTTVDVPTSGGSAPDVSMSISLMPPGFEERVDRPIVYIGGEEEGGLPFYTWNHADSCKNFVPVNKFSARLIDVKTMVKNADDPQKRAVKLVCEFETASGSRVAMSCGAKTYSAIGLISGLQSLSEEQLQGEVGLYGKVGRNGVTFINVYVDGNRTNGELAVDLLREARKDGVQIEAVQGYVDQLTASLKEMR